ncbi:sensor histidine kinase [Phytopseudomonas dryadis]|uniref:histidine kinase n=1 Tax=Phytopseudomonas dryadis TaxID=2487520 RepID=A0A4Q9QTD3_9GAMM|nr:ATP-binding protein [Pseudomonas dryadis]TBU85597.1 two-component sensor histidine kinase [Pseudomonas dryadis]
MMRRFDTLFVRLFAVFMGTIVLAHVLAFTWFSQYGHPPPPPPPPPEQGAGMATPGPPPDESWLPPFLGAPFVFQFLALVSAAWIGARLLARPVSRLGEAARLLSEELDNPPLEETGPYEARQAAAAFNRMQARIREQMQQRGRMLVAVSHDLRTPVARLKLRVEDIESPVLREQFSQDLAEMMALLDSTLAFLHQESMREAPQRLDLQALVEAMAEDACERGDRVQVEGHCAPIEVPPMAMRTCLSNLLENALRYAGHAQICLEDDASQVRIRVIDQGPGIAQAQRERVFEPYFRLESSRNRSSGGVGLGLSIVREAARRMEASLCLSETPGGGLTVEIVLARDAM